MPWQVKIKYGASKRVRWLDLQCKRKKVYIHYLRPARALMYGSVVSSDGYDQ